MFKPFNNKSTKAAVIIGHPGHELRIYKFLKEFTPDVFIITDGSGANNSSRIDNSIRLINALGAKYIDTIQPIPDTLLYEYIIQHNFTAIVALQKSIKALIIQNNYNLIVGDSLEGFNPTHDLCRYLINGIVKEINSDEANELVFNYSFDLDAAPNKIINNHHNNDFYLLLSDKELDDKITAGLNYTELKYEIEKALNLFGKKAFNKEIFWWVENDHSIKNWNECAPLYEKYGKERVGNGIYSEVIEFEKNMKPLANLLLNL